MSAGKGPWALMITAHGGLQNRDFSRIMDSKKKLDSENSRLLSFGEIAVDRALRVRDGLLRSRWLLTRSNGKGGDGLQRWS